MSDNKIKVLHLIVTLPVGGAEDLVASVVTGLDRARFAAAVACLGEPGFIGEELRRRGGAVWSLGLDLKRDAITTIVRTLRCFLAECRPDILHTHLYHPNFYGRLASLGLGLKGVVASVHNAYTRVKIHRCLWNYLLSRVTDRVLVSSAQVYRDVRRWDRVPPAKIRQLPYGIPMAEVESPLTPDQAKAELGLSGFCLGTIGRLEEQKGQEFLLAAVPELKNDIPDLQVIIVGDGRLRAHLERQAQELNLEGIVHFLGARRDLARLYRAMEVFVLPSLWEGLPLALLKAMAAGLPVIATPVSGVEEVITDRVNGRLVPPRQPEALAAAVLELFNRPELRQLYGQRGQEAIRAGYSLEAMLTALERLYEELAAS